MANEVCTSLGLTGKDLSGKLVQIVEAHGSDAGFMTGILMWNASKSDTAVCLLALHNSGTHHQNVTKRLGFNLRTAIDSKTAVVLDPFDTYVEKTGNFSDIDFRNENNLKRLFFDVKEALGSFPGKKCLVVDDLSDLLCLGADVTQVVTFLQCCRALQETDRGLALVVCTHRSEENRDQKLLADFVAHTADYRMTIAGLKTGFSATVTGSVEIVDNLESDQSASRLFHFKLSDRQVRVFAPGSVGIRT
uniref:Elongator complex protein 6 n=2 Tax=Graphocephala atropunctata TaxID=36148 RepID=A0A1B6MU84_9HEMI